jgi:hypothetical protein
LEPGQAIMALKKIRKPLLVFFVICFILIIIRIILPVVLLFWANNQLAQMKGYNGHINDIQLRLLRGTYTIDSLFMNKVDTTNGKATPFFRSEKIDFSLDWPALLNRSLVGNLTFEKPTLVFTKDKVEPAQLLRDSTYLRKLLDDFMPLNINRIEINDGTLRFRDESTKPVVDLEMTHAYLVAQNLRNSYDSTDVLPARVRAYATLYEGSLTFDMQMNPMAIDPTFDLNTELTNTNLVLLNDFFQAYARVDVNRGRFGLYAEAAARDGKFVGYVKPVIKGLDILGKEDRKDNPLRMLWEAMVGGASQVLKNQRKDQLATKVPFEGSIAKSDANMWYAVMNILRNAFVHAMQSTNDNEISLKAVDNPKQPKKMLLQRVFGRKKSKPKP